MLTIHESCISGLSASIFSSSVDKIRKIIMSSPNKSCDLDPLPLTNAVNASLSSGFFLTISNKRRSTQFSRRY